MAIPNTHFSIKQPTLLVYAALVGVVMSTIIGGFFGVIYAEDGELPTSAPPIVLTLSATPSIVEGRRPITVTATLHAKQPATLCLLKDPAAQFTLALSKPSGQVIPLQPIVATLPDALTSSPFKPKGVYHRLVPLTGGEIFQVRLNLSRQLPHLHLRPGEYLLSGEFTLCSQPVFEQPLPQQQHALSIYPGDHAVTLYTHRPARFYQSD